MIHKFICRTQRLIRQTVGRFAGPEWVFTNIYRKNIWGGEPGEACSGGGSCELLIVDPYIRMFREESEAKGFSGMDVVDLGCGDMRVGRKLIPYCGSYTGVDVVRYLIEEHGRQMGTGNIRFLHLDAASDELPDGDVCLVRQVLQHLSNRQVMAILAKLRKYRYVYITEHVPAGNWKSVNRDKPVGAGIRLDHGSGIDITAKPFGIPSSLVRMILEIPVHAPGGGNDAGLIRTVLYEPGQGGGA